MAKVENDTRLVDSNTVNLKRHKRRHRVPAWYWKNIDFQIRFSRPWKSIEIGQNMN